jgi:hypothetical protein
MKEMKGQKADQMEVTQAKKRETDMGEGTLMSSAAGNRVMTDGHNEWRQDPKVFQS